MERYDKIGLTYDSTRKADPYLCERMFELIGSGHTDAHYLDIGCGTGNYTEALAQKGLRFTGMDPSVKMLEKARSKASHVKWLQGNAESIPANDQSFDGVLASLTLHHWFDLEKGFKELFRVMKSGARMVCFTSLPEQTSSYWLSNYFPNMIKHSSEVLPSLDILVKLASKTGFELAVTENYFVKEDLQDMFLNSGKYKPELYLNENFRSGISSFSRSITPEELKTGLVKLEKDLKTGRIGKVIKSHENNLGDYIFLVFKK
ncbi:MAG: class I SAM-dependent methyltransferase [Flavobacteriales bacterium]|nr:class I SAM-dependent methyltransferase [Flavobacteriales bacterium]